LGREKQSQFKANQACPCILDSMAKNNQEWNPNSIKITCFLRQSLNKVEWSQIPAFGRNSDNSGSVAGCLLPRVCRETRRMGAAISSAPKF